MKTLHPSLHTYIYYAALGASVLEVNFMHKSSDVRDYSEFLVRGWYFCWEGGYPFLARFSRGGYEYFAKVPRGRASIFYTHQNKSRI